MSKRKLLLADDSITIQKVVNLTFADEGIEVIAFGDGDTALESLDEVKPDIVLADVHMPGLNGYQICELIRGNEATKNVPVVLLVGSFEPFDKDEADRVGANRYLTKPFSSIAELVAMVNELLEGTTATEDSAIKKVVTDTTDIDHLYERSFIETVEFMPSENLDIEFDDDGIDDEMIQTSYADSDIDSLTNASFFAPGEIDDFIAGPDNTAAESVNSETEETEPESESEDEASSGPHHAEPEESNDNQAYDFFASATGEEPSPSAFENEASIAAHNADLPNGDSLHPFASAETLSFETSDLESKSLKFQFDDLDLLELPTIPEGKSYEFATPEQATDAGSRTQVVSLSPELMEIIVQKVVEKLAEKY